MLFQDTPGLLKRFRKGERDALEQVYHHYVDDVTTVFRHGFSLGTDHSIYVRGIIDDQLQCDLVQDVFMRVFDTKARMAYDGLRPYRPYVLRTLKNLMIDRYRRNKRRPEFFYEDAQKSSHSSEDTAPIDLDALIRTEGSLAMTIEPPLDERLQWEQDMRSVRDYVTSLDTISQRLIQLRFENELPQDGVAQTLGISRRRVRTLEGRVRKGLAKFLRAREAIRT